MASSRRGSGGRSVAAPRRRRLRWRFFIQSAHPLRPARHDRRVRGSCPPIEYRIPANKPPSKAGRPLQGVWFRSAADRQTALPRASSFPAPNPRLQPSKAIAPARRSIACFQRAPAASQAGFSRIASSAVFATPVSIRPKLRDLRPACEKGAAGPIKTETHQPVRVYETSHGRLRYKPPQGQRGPARREIRQPCRRGCAISPPSHHQG